MEISLTALAQADRRLREDMDSHRAAIASLRADRCAAIAAARDTGVPATVIAEALGITRALVTEMVREHRRG